MDLEFGAISGPGEVVDRDQVRHVVEHGGRVRKDRLSHHPESTRRQVHTIIVQRAVDMALDLDLRRCPDPLQVVDSRRRDLHHHPGRKVRFRSSVIVEEVRIVDPGVVVGDPVHDDAPEPGDRADARAAGPSPVRGTRSAAAGSEHQGGEEGEGDPRSLFPPRENHADPSFRRDPHPIFFPVPSRIKFLPFVVPLASARASVLRSRTLRLRPREFAHSMVRYPACPRC